MFDFKEKKVGVLGLGEENVVLAKYLVKQGAKVIICDQKEKGELGDYYLQVQNLPVQFRLGPHYLDHLDDFNVVFRTPGLPYFHFKIQEAGSMGVEISSAMKLFFELCPCPIIGVTGTKGKGTTATLIKAILKRGTSKVYLGGNIGTSPITFLDKLNHKDIVILELSSFQLEDLRISPHIAVILDIKEDHLNYHRDRDEYVEAKKNIVRFQNKNDYAVINADYLTSFEFAVLSAGEIYYFSRRKSVDQGAFVDKARIIFRNHFGQDKEIIKITDIKLRGFHNLENISAAIVAAKLAGVEEKIIGSVIKEFNGLEHRLELVDEQNKISFYNDSFSTTPDTTIAAIQSFSEPVILLLGGSEKQANYRELGRAIDLSSVKMIIAIGQTAPRIINNVSKRDIEIVKSVQTMEAAVRIAHEKANPGDIVLLSPASASFDRYCDYKERGQMFKNEVLKLK